MADLTPEEIAANLAAAQASIESTNNTDPINAPRESWEALVSYKSDIDNEAKSIKDFIDNSSAYQALNTEVQVLVQRQLDIVLGLSRNILDQINLLKPAE